MENFEAPEIEAASSSNLPLKSSNSNVLTSTSSTASEPTMKVVPPCPTKEKEDGSSSSKNTEQQQDTINPNLPENSTTQPKSSIDSRPMKKAKVEITERKPKRQSANMALEFRKRAIHLIHNNLKRNAKKEEDKKVSSTSAGDVSRISPKSDTVIPPGKSIEEATRAEQLISDVSTTEEEYIKNTSKLLSSINEGQTPSVMKKPMCSAKDLEYHFQQIAEIQDSFPDFALYMKPLKQDFLISMLWHQQKKLNALRTAIVGKKDSRSTRTSSSMSSSMSLSKSAALGNNENRRVMSSTGNISSTIVTKTTPSIVPSRPENTYRPLSVRDLLSDEIDDQAVVTGSVQPPAIPYHQHHQHHYGSGGTSATAPLHYNHQNTVVAGPPSSIMASGMPNYSSGHTTANPVSFRYNSPQQYNGGRGGGTFGSLSHHPIPSSTALLDAPMDSPQESKSSNAAAYFQIVNDLAFQYSSLLLEAKEILARASRNKNTEWLEKNIDWILHVISVAKHGKQIRQISDLKKYQDFIKSSVVSLVNRAKKAVTLEV